MEPKPEPQTIKLTDEQIQAIAKAVFDFGLEALTKWLSRRMSQEIARNIRLGDAPEWRNL